MRVERFLEDSAARFPTKTALVCGDLRVTYAQLASAANRLAHALGLAGVERGDRVLLFLPNSSDAVAALFGVLKAGAVFSPINPTTKAGRLSYLMGNCQARAVVTNRALLPVARDAAGRAELDVAILTTDELDWTSSKPTTPPQHGGIDVDVAMIIYTSGSTGLPKGVVMTHRNIEAAATSITSYLENTPDDVILNALPLSFDYGLYQVLMSAKFGGTVVLEPSFAYPYLVIRKMAAEGVTGLPLVPTMAAILLQMKDLKPGDLPRLRYITNTGAALPPSHIQRLQQLFPTTRIYSMYGLTECKRCTYLPPDQLGIRPLSVGKAIPNTEAYIVDERGERVGPGVVGELVIRGPHIMQGYWGDPEATAKRLRPGPYPWEKVLYTGDLFRMDDEGYLYFVGRQDDIIKTRGVKVSPREVEDVLYSLPGVAEAVVVGTPDPILGMAVKAIIVRAAGSTIAAADVLRHCAAHLEDYAVPKVVEFRSSLPKTDGGKIRRSDVQAEELRACRDVQSVPAEACR